MSRRLELSLLAAVLCAALSACSSEAAEEPLVSSRAYKGHESDKDGNSFVTVYPAALGTRLDDCQTCHKGATFTYDKSGKQVSTFKNACDYCHLIGHPDTSLTGDHPKKYIDTLNTYGAAYMTAGRSIDALKQIADQDSDGDGHVNAKEIADLKYPGDAASKPGQKVAPARTFKLGELKALSAHSQFLLSNSNKQQYDNYASYKGVTLQALLEAAGVDLTDTKLQGITLIAPDGYLKDFTTDEITKDFPQGIYYAGLDNATLGAECGFVQYPDKLPSGLTSGKAIPDTQRLLLAYERDGQAMEVCSLDHKLGQINGEGPYRVVVPQTTPGEPDRGSKYSPTTCNDGHDYDGSKDHNAGAMVRGVIAVRVNPLPAGYEDFDYKYGGWAYVKDAALLVYGHGVKTQ
jgi:hypothetical protein